MTKSFSSEGNDFRDRLGQRFVPEFVEELKALTIEIQELYCQDQLPWIVGYSGDKDSTAVLQLVWNAIAALPFHQRTKPIHVISTDTRVENLGTDEWQLLEELCEGEAAIQSAHHDRDLKQAVQEGDVEAVKQIAGWAEIKFGKKEDDEIQG